jgi:hypothetical protein
MNEGNPKTVWVVHVWFWAKNFPDAHRRLYVPTLKWKSYILYICIFNCELLQRAEIQRILKSLLVNTNPIKWRHKAISRSQILWSLQILGNQFMFLGYWSVKILRNYFRNLLTLKTRMNRVISELHNGAWRIYIKFISMCFYSVVRNTYVYL